MATADLKTFVEDRLSALIPGIDISPGSPAQLQFVDPLITYLGTDPFETDIESFISDRFTQEYPDIYAANAGAVRDTFIKPLILVLDPFKRETQAVSKNQSFKDPTVLSDDDADALAANFFSSRDSGHISHGVARISYPNPATVAIDLSNRFFTADGLGFYAITPMTISAEEMAFNRSGLFYFIDIPVQAEAAGAQYNIDPASLVGIDGLLGYAKVDNLQKFVDGFDAIDTPTFVATTKGSLTEQALVTRRGATARINGDFQGSVQAVQIIGAGDVEMKRDIMVADAPGQAWATGMVVVFRNIALLEGVTSDDPRPIPSPSIGDHIYIYLDKYQWPHIPDDKRFVSLLIDDIIIPTFVFNSAPYSLGYLVQWSDPDGNMPVSVDPYLSANGGLIRKGTIHVGSLPSVGMVNLTVNNQEVHVYGHSDIYIRPVLQNASTVVLSSLADDPRSKDFKLQRTTLTTSSSNWVIDYSADFTEVVPGDLLVIETGNNAGTYVIGWVAGVSLFLTSSLVTADLGPVRYRITKELTINPFEPKIPKLPFGTVGTPSTCNDLQTLIGKNVFNFTGPDSDLLAYGAKIGDTIRILENVDAGDFTILGFNTSKSVVVDRVAGGSNSGLTYRVFTKLNPVTLPLVRIKSLDLLDSSQKATGYSIPYAKPLAVVPTSNFTSAQVRGYSQWKSGFVLPNLTGLVGGSSQAATTGDRRYSMGFDPVGPYDLYRAMISGPTGQQAEAELLFPIDAFESCSYFVAVCEDASHVESFPPIDPKEGDALTLKSGPNAGSYNIKSVRKFKYLSQTLTNGVPNTVWVYFIKIRGVFPVDPITSILELLNYTSIPYDVIENGTPSPIPFPDKFTNFYMNLPGLIQDAINVLGGSLVDADLSGALDSLCMADYEWGDPARGVLRSYFYSPTLFQQHTAESAVPTTYSFKNAEGATVQFRADPTRYDKHELLPGRLTSDSNPLAYPRDMTPGGPDETHPNTLRADFAMAANPSIFAEGIQAGDYLSVHEEIFFHGSKGVYRSVLDPQSEDRVTAVITVAGSAKVTAPSSASGPIFVNDLFNDLLFIDEGVDKGAYRVVQVLGTEDLVLDRPLTRTTPQGVSQGANAEWGLLTPGGNVLQAPAPVFSQFMIGMYVTIYGIDTEYQGSYKILDLYPSVLPGGSGSSPSNTIVLDRAGPGLPDFPTFPNEGAIARWVITAAPNAAPKVVGKGTELYGLQPVRIYDEIPSNYLVGGVDTSTVTSGLDISNGSLRGGVKQPYRIYRPNIRRVNPTEMAANQDGAYFFFDTESISLGPSVANNIPVGSYLTADEGTYESEGYEHEVDDFTLTYSTKESGVLKIPTKLLPLDVPDTLNSYLNLVGAPIEVVYEQAGIVQQIQDFLNSTEYRITTANMLARHFLPSYVSYDATYVGGSAPALIAKDITAYINNRVVEAPLDVSEIEKLIDQRGGNPITPTKVFLNIHDWDRREWLEFSENELGGTETLVPYNGTPRVSFYLPGPDMSGQTSKPYGERINLVQQ